MLLDQAFIGGLGNIYVDESLARAGLHPEQRAHGLTQPEVIRLHEAINFVIDKGICGNGTTFRDYLDGIGNKGEFQNDLCVYGRKIYPVRPAAHDHRSYRGRREERIFARSASRSANECRETVASRPDRYRQRKKHSCSNAAARAVVIDTDQIAREVVQTGSSALQSFAGDMASQFSMTMAPPPRATQASCLPVRSKKWQATIAPADQGARRQTGATGFRTGSRVVVFDVPLLL